MTDGGNVAACLDLQLPSWEASREKVTGETLQRKLQVAQLRKLCERMNQEVTGSV